MSRSHQRTFASCMLVAVGVLTGCGATVADPSDSSGPPGVTFGEPSPPCDTGVRVAADGPTYSSLNELSTASDVIIRGRVLEQSCVAGSLRGGLDVHYLVSRIRVESAWPSAGVSSDALTVVQLPGLQEGSTPLRLDDDVVLFLSLEQSADPMLEEALGVHWTPLGWDNGIADIERETLRWRSPLVDDGPVSVQALEKSLSITRPDPAGPAG